MLNMQQILNDSVVSVIFWADAVPVWIPQYEFNVENGRTTTSAFHIVV